MKADIEKVVFTGIAENDFPDLGIAKGQKVLAEYEVEYGIEEEVVGFGQHRKVIKKRVIKEVRDKKLDGVLFENWAASEVNGEWRIFYIQPEIMQVEKIAQSALCALEEEIKTNKRKDVIQKLITIAVNAAEEIEKG